MLYVKSIKIEIHVLKRDFDKKCDQNIIFRAASILGNGNIYCIANVLE